MMFCMVFLQRKKLSLFIVHQSPMNSLPILGEESKSKNEIKGSKLNSQALPFISSCLCCDMFRLYLRIHSGYKRIANKIKKKKNN